MNYTTFFFYNWYFHAHVLSFNADEPQTKTFLHSQTENAFQKNIEKTIFWVLQDWLMSLEYQ